MSVDEVKKLIDSNILIDYIEYCELNNRNVVDLIDNLLKTNMVLLKYGDKPPMFNKDIPSNKVEKESIKPLNDDSVNTNAYINEENVILSEENKENDNVAIVDTPKKNKRRLNVK